MNETIFPNLIRFAGLLAVQIGIFQTSNFEYFDIHIYIVFILLLPYNLIPAGVIAASFFMGLMIDVFQNTMGLCAATAVLIAGLRYPVLTFLEPRGGYNLNQPLTKSALGAGWFFQYSAIMVSLHSVVYVLLEDLTFSWVLPLRMLLVFASSYLVVNLYQFIFNPKV